MEETSCPSPIGKSVPCIHAKHATKSPNHGRTGLSIRVTPLDL